VVCTVTCLFFFSNWCLVCIGVVVTFLVGCVISYLFVGGVVRASCVSSCVSGAAVFLISCLLPAFYGLDLLRDTAPPPVRVVLHALAILCELSALHGCYPDVEDKGEL
jgi:MFS superfamily sulfate permease-like transporter